MRSGWDILKSCPTWDFEIVIIESSQMKCNEIECCKLQSNWQLDLEPVSDINDLSLGYC